MEDLLNNFLQFAENQLKVELYPAQEEAILEIYEGNNVILNTPTGSGKSLVAIAMHFRALKLNRRSFYTCPIKALVNEKFFSLCKLFGPENVGLITGDATVNSKAPIICCTAEILANMALREGEELAVDGIIIDEFHYYADRDRGVAWQIPLLILSRARFLLMSATMGDASFFSDELTKLTKQETKVIISKGRPIPLNFRYEEYPIEMMLEKLVQENLAPIYLVNFTQKECATIAQGLTCVNYCSKEEKQLIATELQDQVFTTPYGKDINRFLRHGIGIHHAGLLPRYRLLEKLGQKGLLKIICGTDTLGVGINLPIRTVVFSKLSKYNGEKVTLLSAREFHQISGRAGRRGFDEAGTVVVMAPAHVAENKILLEKAKQKGQKNVKTKSPEAGSVTWKKSDFDRLVEAPPEPLKSSFYISSGMILNLLSRPKNGGYACKKLIRDCHESKEKKKELRQEGFLIFKSLIERSIVEYIRPAGYFRLNLQLQEDFSLHHTLSLYLIDAAEMIDPYSENYGVRLLTLVESILENPDLILYRQLDRVKQNRLYEMKQQGIEYEERMAELEKLEWPKPDREFIYNTFNSFKEKHPWIGEDNIRPKSIAREIYETLQNFNDYIKEYAIERSEGLLLRYLSEVYRVLTQTLPTNLRNDSLMEIIAYFESMIREVDSSLLDEWERMKNPTLFQQKVNDKKIQEEELKLSLGILADLNLFTNQIRAIIFRFMRQLNDQHDQTPYMEKYFAEHETIELGPNARNKNLTNINRQEENRWLVTQQLVDSEGVTNWSLVFSVDLPGSKEAGRALVKLEKIIN